MTRSDPDGASGVCVRRGRAPALAERGGSGQGEPADWIAQSPLLSRAFTLAEMAHGTQRRPSDGRLFLDHVTEVADFLHRVGYDDELVAAGLLHDSVERGTLEESELRSEMPAQVASLVMTLSEDGEIESFGQRKEALRSQVAAAGGRAITVFAADKLSDILGLRRGIEAHPDQIEERIDGGVEAMVGHYRESVQMIAAVRPGSAFLSALRRELERLEEHGIDGRA